MRSYDISFQPIAVSGHVFFGSSADDTLYCVDASDGSERWSYITDGPIRTAPTYSDGRLLFGSDDGFAYCLNAEDGTLVWKYRPVEPKRLILNNGRFIALHPCRTGVLVDRGRAYFGCALLPWQDGYLCSVDVDTGQPDGEGCYVQQLPGATLEGPPAATSDLLVFPQGRVAPRIFDRSDGKDQGSLKKSSGGSLVVVSLDATLFHGPGADSRKGGINRSNLKTREVIAGHGRGNALVVAGSMSFMLTDDSLIASDLVKRENKWSVPCDQPYSLIGVGELLFAGGRDEVVAYRVEDGAPVWRTPVEGKAYDLAAADGRLFVSTDAGVVHAFTRGGSTKPTVQETAEVVTQTASNAGLVPGEPEKKDAIEVAVGPWLQFTDPDSAVVRWQTKEPAPTVLEYWLDGERRRLEDEATTAQHHVQLTGLRKNRVYRYVIRETRDGLDQATREFECDTFFNFTLPDVDDGESSSFTESTRSVIKRTQVDRGIGLVLGSEKGQLALELAKQTRLRVIAVETDAYKVHASRAFLMAAGVYGSRVTVRQVEDLSKLPFVGNFANLVVSEVSVTTHQRTAVAAEIFRVLRPDGGVACLGKAGGLWSVITRDALPGASGWSHQYGRADNSAFGGEQLVGVETSDDLDVQWIGRPGPRFKPDRNGRKPSPLSTAGRLFVQGMNRIAALDAYNGTVLWSLEIPDLQRYNMPRDCSNWCADRDFVYAAVRDKCWQIDAARGEVVKIHDVVADSGEKFDWGGLVSLDSQLIGTAVKQGTSWINFWGGADAGWYDARSGAVTDKVCADNLFSIDKNTGQTKWKHSQGVIINSTVTVHDSRIYFVECRSRDVIDSSERRIGNPKLWEDQYLVALDASTGKPIWERPIDTEDGKVVFYLAGGTADRLVIVASADEKYHVYGFSTDGGKQLWNEMFRWPGGKGDHGKAMSRPAIVGDRVYVRPHAFQLADGKQLPQQMPGGGCGTYACSSGAIFFRAGTVTMWNQETGKATGWNRLRPDCWLSAIPAAGMLLSAEGGGGCSCGSWMETSVGFMPVAHR
jgi:outer membrane protein assembly factor BamB